jgi:hypothetical protein
MRWQPEWGEPTVGFVEAEPDDKDARIAELEAELDALREDAAVGRAIANLPVGWYLRNLGHAWVVFRANGEFDTPIACGYYNSPYEALDAVGLIEE